MKNKSKGILVGIAGTIAIAGVALTGTALIKNGIGSTIDKDQQQEQLSPAKKDISSLVFNDISDQTYTGEAITPAVIVLDGQKQLEEDKDYTLTYSNNTDVGIANILISAKGNDYQGEKTIHFNIKQANSWIVEPEVTATTKNVGQPKFGVVRVFLKEASADDTTYIEIFKRENGDWTPAEKDYEAISKFYFAKQSITCKLAVDEGAIYFGLEKTFDYVIPYALNVYTIDNQTYTGQAITPTVVVKNLDTSETLTLGTDYTVEYLDNINVGTATAIITFINNYVDVEPETKTFQITQAFNSFLSTPTYEINGREVTIHTGTTEFGSIVYSYIKEGDSTGDWIEITGLTFTLPDSGNYVISATVLETDNYAFCVDKQLITATTDYLIDFVSDSQVVSSCSTSGFLDFNQTLPQNKDGYVFLGWSTIENDKNSIISSDFIEITQDTTFYAIWAEELTDFSFSGDTILNYSGTDSIVDIPESYSVVFDKINGCDKYVVGNDFEVHFVGDGMFSFLHRNDSVTQVNLPQSITTLNFNAFAFSNIQKITGLESVVSIGDFSFQGCQNLKILEFSSNLNMIGECAFKECSNLLAIFGLCGVQTIPDRAFYQCSNLSIIDGLENVTHIESEAFYGCSSLQKIDGLENLINIGYASFRGCSGLISIDLSNVQSLGDLENSALGESFEDCSSITYLDLSNVIECGGGRSFANMTNLKTIIFSDQLNILSASCFADCNALSVYIYGDTVAQIMDFNQIPNGSTIYVKDTLVSEYQTTYASDISNFNYTIVAIPTTEE